MSQGGSAAAAAARNRYLAAFSKGLQACAPQVDAYGACLSRVLPDVQRDCCAAEFQALRGCFFPAVRQAARAAATRK